MTAALIIDELTRRVQDADLTPTARAEADRLQALAPSYWQDVRALDATLSEIDRDRELSDEGRRSRRVAVVSDLGRTRRPRHRRGHHPRRQHPASR